MKNLLFALFLFAFASCADSRKEPLLQDAIAGKWFNVEEPSRRYFFDDDFASSWNYNFSTTFSEKWYSVTYLGGNDLVLSEINTGTVYYWSFSDVAPGDSVCTVVDCTGASNVYFDLKRVR